jgi:hypothetical protein
MKVRRFARQLQFSTVALALMSVGPLAALAQDGHSHMPTAQTNELTPDQKSKASALLSKVRESTERFWAWKDNPNGAFVNSHPNVSCEPFTGKDDPDPRR